MNLFYTMVSGVQLVDVVMFLSDMSHSNDTKNATAS